MIIKNSLIIKNSYFKKKKNCYFFFKKKVIFKYRLRKRLLKKKIEFKLVITNIKSLFFFFIFKNRRSYFKKFKYYYNYVKKLKYIFNKKLTNIFIFSHFIYLGGFSFTLLKEFFVKEIFDFCLLDNHWMFEPLKIDKFLQNSIYLYKKKKFFLKNKLLLNINNNLKMFEMFSICKYLLNLTLIPYNFIPISFISPNYNSLVISSFYLNFYNYNINFLINNNISLLYNYFVLQLKFMIIFFIIFFINILKKIIVNYF